MITQKRCLLLFFLSKVFVIYFFVSISKLEFKLYKNRNIEIERERERKRKLPSKKLKFKRDVCAVITYS